MANVQTSVGVSVETKPNARNKVTHGENKTFFMEHEKMLELSVKHHLLGERDELHQKHIYTQSWSSTTWATGLLRLIHVM